MNEKNLEDLKPFASKPYWDPNAEITLSGSEFEALFTTFHPFMQGAFVMQSVFDRGLKDGTFKVKYEYTDGSGEVSEDELKAYTVAFQKMLEEQQNVKVEAVEKEVRVKPDKKSKIITEI